MRLPSKEVYGYTHLPASPPSRVLWPLLSVFKVIVSPLKTVPFPPKTFNGCVALLSPRLSITLPFNNDVIQLPLFSSLFQTEAACSLSPLLFYHLILKYAYSPGLLFFIDFSYVARFLVVVSYDNDWELVPLCLVLSLSPSNVANPTPSAF